jgi:thioesterase domain-containing protein
VELSVLFGGATVERIAEEIEKGEEEQGEEEHEETRAPLVTVQAGGSRRPFFFLHGQWEGGALYSLELAHALGPEQPFYLLEPYRFEGLKVLSTLEEVAAEHIRAMRRVQPEGPYQFGGWCNGGLIAYEMARQLWAQGQTVDPLVLMDSDAPAPRFKWDRRVVVGLCRLLQLGPDKQADWFLTYRHLRLAFHYWRLEKKQQHEPAGQDEPVSRLTGLRAIFPASATLRQDWIAIYDWIAAGYMPHLYSGKITFFWTEEEPWRRKGWRKLIRWRNVDSHIIPGDHMTSRTRYLPVLAEHLRQCIDKVR